MRGPLRAVIACRSAWREGKETRQRLHFKRWQAGEWTHLVVPVTRMRSNGLCETLEWKWRRILYQWNLDRKSISFWWCWKEKKMREWKKWRPMRLFRWEKLFVRGTKREILHCTFFMQKFSIWLATTKSFACTDVGISVFLYRNLFNSMNFCPDWFPKVTHTNLNDST